MKNKLKKSKKTILIIAAIVAAAIVAVVLYAVIGKPEDKTVELRIIATSDLHGRMLPFDYSLNQEDDSGSMAQLSTAIDEYRTDNTFLVDAGDLIQGNAAGLFIEDDIHPGIEWLNWMGYDVFVTGNHEYDYSVADIKKNLDGFNNTVLTGNVFYNDGTELADGYVIKEQDGIRVAFIGMTTNNNAGWSSDAKEKLYATDALDETREIVDSIEGKYDVLIGVFHMGLNNEFDIPDTGVTDICKAIPEFDVMIASHEHKEVDGMNINNVLVVENMSDGRTMSVVDLRLVKNKKKWDVDYKTSECVKIESYQSDSTADAMFAQYDEIAKEDAMTTIGLLEGNKPLVEDEDSGPLCPAVSHDNAMVDLINDVQMYYTGASVSCTTVCDDDSNLMPGKIHRCDLFNIYKFQNTLYLLHMTGEQLKKFMEYNAKFYNTFETGDEYITQNENEFLYNYYIFDGVRYEIDVSKPVGNRIKNLTWMDGTPVKDDDEFEIAVNNYLADTVLLIPGVIYDVDGMPQVVQRDVRSDIGDVTNMIGDYIENVRGGVITAQCNENWKLVKD